MDAIEREHDGQARYRHAQEIFLHVFNVWKETREVSIEAMRSVADGLDQLEKDITISQTAGTATSLVGGIVVGSGLIAAPFTFGASAIIAGIVGAGLGLAGGVLTTASSISKFFIKKYKLKAAERDIELDQKIVKELIASLMSLNEACEVLTHVDKQDHKAYSFMKSFRQLCKHLDVQPRHEAQFAHSVGHLLSGISIIAAEIGISASSVVKSGTKTGLMGAELANNVRRGANVIQNGGMVVRSGCAIAGGVLSSVGIVVDIGFLVYLGKKLKKGSPSDVAKEMRKRADTLEQQLPKFDEFAERFAGPPPRLERLYLNARRKISQMNLRDFLLCFAVLLFGTLALVMWLRSGSAPLMTALGFPRSAEQTSLARIVERPRLVVNTEQVLPMQGSFAWKVVYITLGGVFTFAIASLFSFIHSLYKNI